MKRYLSTLMILFLVLAVFAKNKNRVPASLQSRNEEFTFGWHQTFEDQFDSAETAIAKGSPAECFSKPASCANEFEWDNSLCDAKFNSSLKDLNKCNWKVFNYYNYMDFEASIGEGINAFDPSKVKVENGKLILSADRSTIPKDKINCKNKYKDSRFQFDAFTKECGISSGGVNSRERFSQAYGRFEVKAKLSKGQGSWPAIWMMPENGDEANYPEKKPGCGWPYIGEIDIMEQWSNNFENVQSQWIHGYCQKKLDVRKNFTTKITDSTEAFHLYGLEWTPHSLCFFQDDTIAGCIYENDLIKSKNLATGKYENKQKAWIPDYPFYLILNLTIEQGIGSGKIKVDLDTFKHQEMIIDYVRTYRRCNSNDPKESCQHFMMKGDWGVNGYNNFKNETAFAEINAYPNPIAKTYNSGQASLSFRLFQNCEDVKIDFVNLLGQSLATNDESQNGTPYLFSGSLEKDKVLTKKINISQLPSGMYMIRAEYSQCGESKSGMGNQVFKLVVVDDKLPEKTKKPKKPVKKK